MTEPTLLMNVPRFISIPRALGVLAVLLWSCCVVGSYRTTGFGFEMGTILAQLFISLISTVPACLMITDGLPWLRKLALVALATFAGITFSHIHAGLQEDAALKKFGAHPATRLVVHRWFPYGQATMRFEPQLGTWMGDD